MLAKLEFISEHDESLVAVFSHVENPIVPRVGDVVLLEVEERRWRVESVEYDYGVLDRQLIVPILHIRIVVSLLTKGRVPEGAF